MSPTPDELAHSFPGLAAALTPRDLGALANALELRELTAGDRIVTEGEPASKLFLVHAGSLLVQLRTEVGVIEVTRLGAGDMVAEIGFIDGGPSSATVSAAETSTVWALSQSTLQGLAGPHPDVATKVLASVCATVARRIRTASDRFDELAPGETVTEGAPGLLQRLSLLFGLARS